MAIALHLSALPYYTVSGSARAGMPSLTKLIEEFEGRGWSVIFTYVEYGQGCPPPDRNKVKFIPIILRNYLQGSGAVSGILGNLIGKLAPWLICRSLYKYGAKLMKHNKIDLLYAHGAPAVVAAGWLKRRYHIPVVARLYGLNDPQFLLHPIFSVKRLYWSFPEILALRSNVDLIVITDDGTHGKDVCKRFRLGDRGLVLRNGVDIPKGLEHYSKEDVRTSLNLPQDAVLITYVGRLASWKRVDRILNVALLCKEVHPRWVFIVIGSGPEEGNLRRFAETHDLRNVIWIPAIPHDMVWKYLKASDLFLSLHDLSSLSNTLIEALAVSLPVVCSRKGQSIEEVVGSRGMLVDDPDSHKEVINALEMALSLYLPRGEMPSGFPSWEERLSIEFEKINCLICGGAPGS